jgi:transposase
MKRPSFKRAEALVKVASNSIGRTSGKLASEASLKNLLAQYDLYCKQYEALEQLMLELLMQVPNASKLLDIKGVGLSTAATFVGEVGDISRFQDPRQIQKLAGFNLVANSSGKHKGKTTISKRGRKTVETQFILCHDCHTSPIILNFVYFIKGTLRGKTTRLTKCSPLSPFVGN